MGGILSRRRSARAGGPRHDRGPSAWWYVRPLHGWGTPSIRAEYDGHVFRRAPSTVPRQLLPVAGRRHAPEEPLGCRDRESRVLDLLRADHVRRRGVSPPLVWQRVRGVGGAYARVHPGLRA